NLISLGAVDFGIIIDSAVVLVEALMVRLAIAEHDGNPQHASVGWRMHTLKTTAIELGHPILFSKAIIITAFLPIFTFQRVEGKIFTPMTYTLSFALAGAILLTLTLVPALLGYAMTGPSMAEKENRWMQALQMRYRAALGWVDRHRSLTIGGSLALLALALLPPPPPRPGFLPQPAEGNTSPTVFLPPPPPPQRPQTGQPALRWARRRYP